MRKVVEIIMTERDGINNVGVELKGITNNVDVVTAAFGLVRSISPRLGVTPKDVAKRMVNFFDVEEKNARGVSGGAGAVSREGEKGK